MTKNYKLSLADIKKLEKDIIVMIDTREKKNQHITSYFDKYKIPYESKKLDYGDYSFYIKKNDIISDDLYFHKEIVIERKATLEELSNNLTRGRERFEKELLKARADNCKMFLIVENRGGINTILEHGYNTDFKPVAYITSLKAFENRYNLHINFLDAQYMGYDIKSTFYYFLREYFI